MINLQDTINRVCMKATTHRPYIFNTSTLQSGKQVLGTNKLGISKIPNSTSYQVDVLDPLNNLLSNVDMGPIYGIAGVISRTAFATTQYANVTEAILFKAIYDVRDRPFFYVENGIDTQKNIESAPCMECGLLLPLRNLTVDHQRPQTGGALEAILKTFRAFGLTKEGPKGAKGQMILAHLRTGIPLHPAVPKLGRGPLAGTSVVDRYTLSDEGAILYSFIIEGGNLEDLKSNCMHGLLNLRPLCGACNSGRGNPLKF